MDQLLEGLAVLDIVSYVRKFPNHMKPLFVCRSKTELSKGEMTIACVCVSMCMNAYNLLACVHTLVPYMHWDWKDCKMTMLLYMYIY